MFFGRTGRTADAVTTGTAANQQHDIARFRHATNDLIRRHRADDRADFHAFGDVTGVVVFTYLTGRETDLVAVRTVTGRRLRRNRALRQFTGKRCRKRRARIAAAGHAHRLVNVRASAQGIANAAAQTGGCSAERFNFCRVVVRFVLKEQQPFFHALLGFDRNLDRAGVDFFRLVQLLQKSLRAQ